MSDQISKRQISLKLLNSSDVRVSTDVIPCTGGNIILDLVFSVMHDYKYQIHTKRTK